VTGRAEETVVVVLGSLYSADFVVVDDAAVAGAVVGILHNSGIVDSRMRLAFQVGKDCREEVVMGARE
jgi:hypothetical protein